MEMQFDRMPVAYLQKLTGQHRFQEQTQEVRLPEGMPDIGRVLGAWGQVILRGKEWNGDHMAVSCGVMVWVLYMPEEGEDVHSVEAWLPFSMKWDLPDTHRDGRILSSCFLQSVDARSTSARKLMVRATMGAMGEAWQPDQLELAFPGQISEGVELLTNTYPVLLPKETGEKAFLLEEQLEPTATGVKPEKLLYYNLRPEIADQKMMAGKAVFRGNGMLHVLYRGTDGRLYTSDYDLPFSQYADLEGSYDQDPTVFVYPCVTSVDLILDEEGKLQLKAGVLGQYMVYERTMLTVAEDAYSPGREVIPMQEQLMLPAVLEQAAQSIHAEQNLQMDARQIADVTFCPSVGQTERTDTGVRMILPGQFQMLYYDPEGELQGTVSRWEGQLQLNTDTDSSVDAKIQTVGRPQAIPGAGEITLRSDVAVDTVTTAGQGINVITGLDMGETIKPDPHRPSLILCKKGNDRLWDVAKRSGSTVARIMEANGLEEEPGCDQILLIPIA